MEENEKASAKMTLPSGYVDYLESWTLAYGLDAVAQGLRDVCAKHAKKNELEKLTTEQRRKARLWGFSQNDAERFLRATLDHGPESGCK